MSSAFCSASTCKRSSACAPGCPYFNYDKYYKQQNDKETLVLKRREVAALERIAKKDIRK